MKPLMTLCTLLVLVSSVSAADHQDMSYQGQLTDLSGQPVPDGSYSVTFSLWDAAVGGTELWSQAELVTTTNGIFNVLLDNPFEFLTVGGDLAPPDPVHLQVQIGADPPFAPRTQLGSVINSVLTHRVLGDVFTSPGRILILPEGGTPPDDNQPIASIKADPGQVNLDLLHRSAASSDSSYFGVTTGNAGAEALELDWGVETGAEGSSGSARGDRDPSTNKLFSAFQMEAYDGAAITKTVDTVFADQLVNSTVSNSGQGDSTGLHQLVSSAGFSWHAQSTNAMGDSSSITLVGNAVGSSVNIYGANPPDDGRPQINMFAETDGTDFWLGLIDETGGETLPVISAQTNTEAVLNVGFASGGPPDDNSPPPDETKPGVAIGANAVNSSLTLQGPDPGAAGIKRIVMTADDTEARVGINTDAPTSALYVSGDIVATGAITELSDARLKENINQIDDALEVVDQIRGVTFEWRQDQEVAQNLPDGVRVGLLAQEVESVLTEAVISPEGGYKSVDYSRLTPILIEAIKAQQKQIDQLREELASLRANRN